MQKIVSFLKKKKDTTNWSNFDREDAENERVKAISKKGSSLETQYNSTNYHQLLQQQQQQQQLLLQQQRNSKNGGGSSSGGSVIQNNQNNKGVGEGSRGMVQSPSNNSISSSGSTTSNSTNNKIKSNNNNNSGSGSNSGKKRKKRNQNQNQNDVDSDDFIPGEVRSISKILDFSKSERKWLAQLNIPQELLDQNIDILLNVLNFLSKKDGILYIQAQNNRNKYFSSNHINNSNYNGSSYSSNVNSRSNSIISNNSSSITPSTSSSNLYQQQQQQQQPIHSPQQLQSQQQLLQQQQQQQQQSTLNPINEDNQNCTYNQQSSSNQSTPTLTIQAPPQIQTQQLLNNPHSNSKSNLNSLLSSSSGGTISVIQDGAIPPQPMRRSDYNRIFIEPGKYYAFPEAESYALARVVIEEEDPSKLFRTSEFIPEIKGAFGIVYQVFYVNGQYNNIDVALKKMDHKSEKRRRNNLNEISILKYLKHPNIVTYINSYEKNDEEIWMVMEYMDGGTIKEALSNLSFNEKYVAYIAREILHSLEYLHSLNIAHRDIKSSNVMINTKAEVKLIDFGFAIDLTHLKQDIMMCGSPYYMSPEQIKDQPHGLAVDIWSLGILVAEMMRQVLPHHKSKIKAMFLAGTVGVKFSKEKKSSSHWSSEVLDFLNCCLQMDPSKRSTPTQLLQHPFLATAATKQEMVDLLPLLFMSKTLSKISRLNLNTHL